MYLLGLYPTFFNGAREEIIGPCTHRSLDSEAFSTVSGVVTGLVRFTCPDHKVERRLSDRYAFGWILTFKRVVKIAFLEWENTLCGM